jgi:endoglucanase
MSTVTTPLRGTLLQAVLAITVGLVCLATMFATPARALGEGYWSTDGAALVDSNGDEVRITGVNWFGFETSVLVPHGLWQRNWQDMLDQIADVGFNTIRLPYSSALLGPGAMPDSIDYVANPDLQGLSSLEVMDRIIEYSGEIGLKIILDRHTLEPDNRHELWYNAAYPPERLISDWQTLAERYLGDPTVIGADIYNEPHGGCWGCGDTSIDWRLAAEQAGNAIHDINPEWLIFVEGVACGDAGCTWWGGDLSAAGEQPVQLDVPNKIVYSPHEYATSVANQDWFEDPSFPANMEGIWDTYWGYLLKQDIAPVMHRSTGCGWPNWSSTSTRTARAGRTGAGTPTRATPVASSTRTGQPSTPTSTATSRPPSRGRSSQGRGRARSRPMAPPRSRPMVRARSRRPSPTARARLTTG